MTLARPSWVGQALQHVRELGAVNHAYPVFTHDHHIQERVMAEIWTPDDPQPHPKTFWVLERDGRYVALNDIPSGAGGFICRADWTDDLKEARHWPTQQYADHIRRSLDHPFWMSDPVEHAMISQEVYADGLADEIGRLKAELADHRKHVGAFLNDLYATLIGPCDTTKERTVTQCCEALLDGAQKQRQYIADIQDDRRETLKTAFVAGCVEMLKWMHSTAPQDDLDEAGYDYAASVERQSTGGSDGR